MSLLSPRLRSTHRSRLALLSVGNLSVPSAGLTEALTRGDPEDILRRDHEQSNTAVIVNALQQQKPMICVPSVPTPSINPPQQASTALHREPLNIFGRSYRGAHQGGPRGHPATGRGGFENVAPCETQRGCSHPAPVPMSSSAIREVLGQSQVLVFASSDSGLSRSSSMQSTRSTGSTRGGMDLPGARKIACYPKILSHDKSA
ncbi:hypothetical protein L596_024745 [Steinernema carpocapsae]|uniref:Uncharacterized protein n=1 Tax=Steinernema carpocapsae TaxID=34508 RepID=A0A4U5M5P0_STECR|nr:hypothetical protein L596_024745 [Steinernema carpocapsae]